MTNNQQTEILRVLVGSHAHGLATPESDRDYRGVFVVPTSEILKLGGSPKTTKWLDGDEDNTNYEIEHFLQLATKSNPSILEVFKAPIICKHFDNGGWHEGELSPYGQKLRALFPFIWSSIGVYNAFLGYSHNQHKKMFDNRDEFSKRRGKYAVTHLRVLLSGIELLRTGDFSVRAKDFYLSDAAAALHIHLPQGGITWMLDERGYTNDIQAESWRNFLFEIKGLSPNELPIGLIVDSAEYLKSELKKAYEANPNKETDLDKVNEFLLKVRKEHW